MVPKLANHSRAYLDKLRMLHEYMVKHVVEIKSTKNQVNQQSSQVGYHPQADNLAHSPALRPWDRVNVRSEEVTVSYVQHMIHGSLWRQ